MLQCTVWLQVPQQFCFTSFYNTWPDHTDFKPLSPIQLVMTIWAADSLSCKRKAKKKKKNWQKLVLNYVCQRVWNEKLKCVKIIRFYWEKGGMDLQWFGPLWWFVLFFTDISRLNHVSSQDGGRCSKENINGIQFSFLFSLHMQPINIIYLMKTNSIILRDASIHKNAFHCHHNTVLEITVWLAFGTSQVGHKP